MNRLCIVQPLLSNYTWEAFRGLAEHVSLDFVFSPTPPGLGFRGVPAPESERVRFFEIPTLAPLGSRIGMIQWGLTSYILRERPDAILIFANPRYLSFWTTLLWGRWLKIPVYAHGHGIYKNRRLGTARRFMMKALLRLAASYICYAPAILRSFIVEGFPLHKLSVAENSMINTRPVRPEEKNGRETGILFIGRLRRNSNVQMLVRVIERLRRTHGLPLKLHVIGTGEEASWMARSTAQDDWIVWHGELYDAAQIREISLKCFAGCYPGGAGLSVVHMMSLSLPVITHDDLQAHGPEPSFLRDGRSGLLYDHEDAEESLGGAIRALASDPLRVARMQEGAFEDYLRLVNPSLATRLWSILGDGENSALRVEAAENKPPAEGSAKAQAVAGQS